MANYNCVTRSNYFRIGGCEDSFLTFMSHVHGTDDDVAVWTKEIDDTTYYGFGCYGCILGYVKDGDDDPDYGEAFDTFVKGLQTFIEKDDAVIVMEAGHEKLRYVTGFATVITKEDCETCDMTALAVDRARELLGYSWNTVCEY